MANLNFKLPTGDLSRFDSLTGSNNMNVNWNSLGLNNVSNITSQNTGGGFNNAVTNVLGNNWSGTIGSIIGTGLTAYGTYKSYKSYKSMKFSDYENPLAYTQLDIQKSEMEEQLHRTNSEVMEEARGLINYNAYAQAQENRQNQGFNQQAYSNSIFNVSRQAQDKTNKMYKNLEKLDLNTAAAKNAEKVRQEQEFQYLKMSAFNNFRQGMNSAISQIQEYTLQLENIPLFNKNTGTGVVGDSSLVDNYYDPTKNQLDTVQSRMSNLSLFGMENTQDFLAKGNRVMLGQFLALTNKKFQQTGLQTKNLRVPNLSEIYFNFE